MNGLIAITDFGWYEYLLGQSPLDEVNFWRPSDTRTPRRLVPQSPFIFKLKEGHGGHIVGFGIYERFSLRPAWFAWETFGNKNGASTYEEMIHGISRLRRVPPKGEAGEQAGQDLIGCLMISNPIFFDRPLWIEKPRDWPKSAVQGKTYDLSIGEGKRVWQGCQQRAMEVSSYAVHVPSSTILGTGERYGSPTLIRPRKGQGIFRDAVLDAYGNRCAVTREHSLPVLDAAHIRPYSEGGEHAVSNGLPLRRDIHRLFDLGFVTVTPENRFLVGKRLANEWHNGRAYYDLDGQRIEVPQSPESRPDPDLLRWHMDEKFLG